MDIPLENFFIVSVQNDAYELAMAAGKLLQMYFRDPLSEPQDLKVSYKDSKGRDPPVGTSASPTWKARSCTMSSPDPAHSPREERISSRRLRVASEKP